MNTRDKIMTAACGLFEQKGFAAATTREIAARAGVSEVTLFRHFHSKRGLFDETLRSRLRPYDALEYLTNGVTYDLAIDLKHIARAMLETYRQNAPLLRMVMRDKIRDSAPEKVVQKNERTAEQALLTYFTAMKEAGRISAEPEMALRLFAINITGYFFRELFGHADSDGDRYFTWMLEKLISVLEA